MGMRLPFLSKAPGPTAMTLASLSFSTLDSGRKMPLAVLVSALMRWTRTRSRRGARARMERIEVAYRGLFRLAPAPFFPSSCSARNSWSLCCAPRGSKAEKTKQAKQLNLRQWQKELHQQRTIAIVLDS